MNVVYLLPCSCGKKVPVDVGQAGAKVSCDCGQQLAVPPFRALKELERAALASPAASQEAPNWSASRGILFSFGLLISVIAAVLTCYHLYIYSQMWDGGDAYKQAHLEEMRHGVEHMTAVESLIEFQKMAESGLTIDGVPPWSTITEMRDTSRRWLMGALIALAVGLVSLTASLLRPRTAPPK